jgi:hypothetical protein
MAGGIKGQAYIDHLYYELGTGGVGTFTVTISYGNMEAQATILATPPTDHNIQDQILSLGEAFRKGAQSATLFSYPKKPQKLFGAPNLFSPSKGPLLTGKINREFCRIRQSNRPAGARSHPAKPRRGCRGRDPGLCPAHDACGTRARAARSRAPPRRVAASD